MKLIIILPILILASTNEEEKQSEASTKPEFQFGQLVTNTTFSMSSEAFGQKKYCTKLSQTSVECKQTFSVVAGTRTLISGYEIHNKQLYRLYITGDRISFPTVLRAFNQKYGTPCSFEKKNVQNRRGASFTSLNVTWCFKTGKLVMKERGFSVDTYYAEYLDDANQPPKKEAIIDF